MNRFKSVLRNSLAAALCVVALIPAAALAKRISTRIKAPATDTTEFRARLKTYPYHATEFERVSDAVTFMAYDKKASADRETFFVDNGSSVAISSLEVEISYYNTSGKLIHKRTVEINQTFPPKETRKVDISSWDRQKSFHYVNSVPSTKGSSPYTVRFKVLSFIEGTD